MEDVMQYFLTQGPFAVLFVWLFIHQMKSSEARELRYQNLLEAMTAKYDDIAEEIRKMKDRLPPRQ
ncbi:BhlA/UviB family holin-like peptide [Bacillus chungangensis]|uniref:Holin n=1 Tax=Bacillus chungangensis TaxID=587633 RepID=A0ABT9WMI3_9BACI|nr:BhlA/UviB family holin-like peptide [Bacillus chungangensis]MDQ0174363.1 hypothetical protein [Bacillus chungangensis]